MQRPLGVQTGRRMSQWESAQLNRKIRGGNWREGCVNSHFRKQSGFALRKLWQRPQYAGSCGGEKYFLLIVDLWDEWKGRPIVVEDSRRAMSALTRGGRMQSISHPSSHETEGYNLTLVGRVD